MRIQRTELAVYNARAVDLLKRWQEHRIPCGDIDAVAGPQPDSMAALLGYEAEAIPFGLVDPPFIVEGFVDECREHRSICGIHAFCFGSEGFGISLCFGVSAANATTRPRLHLRPQPRSAQQESPSSHSRLSGVRHTRPRIKTRQQYGENASQEYAVKSSGAADRSDRRAEAAYLVEIGKIRADQRTEAASDIGRRRRVLAREDYCDDRGHQDGHEDRDRDAETGNWFGHPMNHQRDDGRGH